MKRACLVLVALTAIGCGGINKDDLVGTWIGKAGMTYAAMQKDASGETEQSEFLAAQEMQQKTLTLVLEDGGKATFTNNSPIEGTWSLDGSTVTLTLPPADDRFGGTYRLDLEGKDKMSGPDPSVEGYTLHFSR